MCKQLQGKGQRILGVRVDNVGEEEALEIMEGFLVSGRPHHVVTVNPEYIIQAWDSPAFREVLNGTDLSLADGVGVIWAARLLGCPLKARLPGVDMVWRLAERAAEKSCRIFLLGGREGVAQGAARALKSRYPSLEVAGVYAGSPNPEEEDTIADMVMASGAHLLLVAYGAPQQDWWIRRNLERTGASLVMGVGGALDYISGRVKRSPRWMQRWGLEWLFRLMVEPWRWRRMLRLPRFAFLVVREAMRPSE